MNNDNNKKVIIDTEVKNWEQTQNIDVFIKILSKHQQTQTALIKINKGANLSQEAKTRSVEVFVIEGTYTNEFGDFPEGSYLRLPEENEEFVTSFSGCTIFKKTNYFTDNHKVIIKAGSQDWVQGQGNLRVMPLFEQTALVKWPKGERFVPHSHWGGEEILVLQGCFMDEHGKYPKGVWIRSPHLSKHFPYVEEETIILVQTGHLWED